MSVGFGSPLSSANTNAAFVSRTVDTDMVGTLDNQNITDSSSTTTGAVKTAGGLGVAKKGYINQVFVPSLAGSKALVSSASKEVVESTVTTTELGYVSGVLSPIQAQIDNKANDSSVVHNTGNESVAGIKTFTDDAQFDQDVVIDGNLTVNGTTTTVNSATLDVTDQNITVNNGGNDATGEGAGLTVDRTGTSGSLVYEDALTSKWKAGALGSESEMIVASGSQTMTGNKTFTGKVNANGEINLAETIDATSTGANATIPTTSPSVRLTLNTLTSISNVDDTFAGKLVVLTNDTTNTIVINNDSGGTAAKRIITGTGANLSLENNKTLILSYDSNISRWSIVGGTGTSFASPLTTKGDLFTYDTGDARLPVGTDGQMLVADSAESTGLKWVNKDSDKGFIRFTVAADFSTTSATFVTPTDASYATFTNGGLCIAHGTTNTLGFRVASLTAGTYEITFSGTMLLQSGAGAAEANYIITDGTLFGNLFRMDAPTGSAISTAPMMSGLFTYGSTQTNIDFEVQMRRNSGVGTAYLTSGSQGWFFTIIRVGN